MKQPLKAMMTISALMMLLLTSGCTSHQVFEGIKARNQNECYRLPESQQQDCLEASDISFEEYQRQRKDTEESESTH